MSTAAERIDDQTIKSKGELSSQHSIELRTSGLSDATIRSHGFRTVTDPKEIAKILNWTSHWRAAALGPCLQIPFFGLDARPREFSRLKPSQPRTEQKPNGEYRMIKYEQPLGESSRCYFPLGAIDAISGGENIAITEGEKKALSLTDHGIPTIGLTGIWNWQQKREDKSGPRLLIDDLAAIDWRARKVQVLIDGDERRNDAVIFAACSLAQVLALRGAWPEVIRLRPLAA